MSAVTRAAISGMSLKRSVRTPAGPPQYDGLASSTSSLSGRYEFTLNGPDPTGRLKKPGASILAAGRIDSREALASIVPSGVFVLTRTVVSLGASTVSTAPHSGPYGPLSLINRSSDALTSRAPSGEPS